MRQQSLADGGFEKYRKKTRKEVFLEEMDQIIPWQELTAAIEPFYQKPQGAGRRPKGAERMLRIHFLQHGFELSDPAAEEALYDSRAMRQCSPALTWGRSRYRMRRRSASSGI